MFKDTFAEIEKQREAPTGYFYPGCRCDPIRLSELASQMTGTEAGFLCQIRDAEIFAGIRGNPALRFLQRRPVELNPQEPVPTDTIIDNFLGFVTCMAISTVLGRLISTVLPQTLMRDNLLALFRHISVLPAATP